MRESRGSLMCLILSVCGLALSSYLVVPHLGLLRSEIIGGAVCGGGGAFNCHVVTGSVWGSFLGVPLALWGVVVYVAFMALALLARQSSEWARDAFTLIFGLACVCVAVDMFLLSIMAFVLRAFCLLCLLTYLVNLSILFVSATSLQQPWPQALRKVPAALGTLLPSASRPAAWLFWGMLAVGLMGSAGLHAATTFVGLGTLGDTKERMRQFVESHTRVNVDVTGDPMKGPADAPIRIIEFSDMRCPVCQRASQMNPIILANHRKDAVLFFKHYPLDTVCNDKIGRQVHPGACQLAAASECAHLQGKFWEMHDRIFEKGKDYKISQLKKDARKIGLDLQSFRACMDSGEGMEAVKRDIAEGTTIEVRSTPTYVINGVRVAGVVSPSTFEDLIGLIEQGSR